MSPVLAFGDDRSDHADLCWSWIIAHSWDGWALEVVTADPPADMHPVPVEETVLHPWSPPDPRDTSGSGFVSVEHLRAEIDPRLALIARPWDLVAIGPRGSGFLKSLHLGSTADWLLREPSSPLVIARRPEPVRRVLVAADGSDHIMRAVATLASLPWLSGTLVDVVAVEDGGTDVQRALDLVTDLLARTDAAVETTVRTGKPAKVVVDLCERTGADLVVLGARGEGGLKRLVLGSTTTEVIGSTEQSMLVAHAAEAATV